MFATELPSVPVRPDRHQQEEDGGGTHDIEQVLLVSHRRATGKQPTIVDHHSEEGRHRERGNHDSPARPLTNPAIDTPVRGAGRTNQTQREHQHRKVREADDPLAVAATELTRGQEAVSEHEDADRCAPDAQPHGTGLSRSCRRRNSDGGRDHRTARDAADHHEVDTRIEESEIELGHQTQDRQ